VFFLVKVVEVEKKFLNESCNLVSCKYPISLNVVLCDLFSLKKSTLKKTFLKRSITSLKIYKFLKKSKKINFFIFLNKFLLNFLEFFLKTKILFCLKKGTNKLILKQLGSRKFYIKYFKKNLKITKQIIGVLYYSFLLKDSTIFVNFFKKVLEKLSIKSHKKAFLGLKKLLKDLFVPLFSFLGVYGMFFNIKGKIGVSGNAKKRRYYFYYGKHSITNRKIKIDIKHSPV
jgi:hypothetical protein